MNVFMCVHSSKYMEEGEGNGNEAGYVLDFLCITAMCGANGSVRCLNLGSNFFAMDGGHVANCAASRFKIASQNQSLASSK